MFSVDFGVYLTQEFIKCMVNNVQKELCFLFYAFMLMSVPMLHFVQNTVSRSVQWVPQIWIFLLYMNAVLQGCMNLVFKIPFIHMLFITHLLLFTGVISMTYLLWKEYQRNRTQELNLALKAFVVLGLSGVTAACIILDIIYLLV